jgi:hypothetical protein
MATIKQQSMERKNPEERESLIGKVKSGLGIDQSAKDAASASPG